MKNIHVLPTDKPSRLYKTGDFLLLDSKAMPNNTLETKNQHIYITSDEEIKEERLRWIVDNRNGMNGFIHQLSVILDSNVCPEIILTTDQDLIKDGVQAIDDEFLEWFVKNPSCEFVEVTEYLDSGFSYGYKIIIPKEEPFKHKVEVLSKEEILANRSNAYEFIDFDKQETLEELKKWREEALIAHEINQKVIKKLMDEKKLMYSEEKIDKILQKLEEIKIMINIR